MERNEENEMLKLSEIDVNKCFIDDTVGFWDGFWERRNGLGAAPVYADPDSASETLRNYHQALWSRKLPNGEVMTLQKAKSLIILPGMVCVLHLIQSRRNIDILNVNM